MVLVYHRRIDEKHTYRFNSLAVLSSAIVVDEELTALAMVYLAVAIKSEDMPSLPCRLNQYMPSACSMADRIMCLVDK